MDSELVNRIVKEVLAALGGKPVAGAAEAAPSGGGPGASIPSPGPSGRALPQGRGVDAPAPRKVFITADMLRERLAAGAERGLIALAWNEFLTPGAQDVVHDMRLTVRKGDRPATEEEKTQANAANALKARGVAAKTQATGSRAGSDPTSPDASSGSSTTSAGQKSTIGLVVYRGGAKVSGVVTALSRGAVRVVEFAGADCVIRNVTALCEALAAGTVPRGVVIAPYGASLMALAGKFPGVRAVQGTRRASVEAALRQYAANLLVVEYAFSTFHEMRALIEVFASAPPAPPKDKTLTDAISRLEGP